MTAKTATVAPDKCLSRWAGVDIEECSTPPVLDRDGRRWFGWGANRPYLGGHLEVFSRLAAQGLHHFHCDASCSEDIYHPELRFWHGPDDFRSEQQEKQFAGLLEICPEALLQLRIYAGCPDWWMEAHPEEAQIYGDGSDQCEIQRTPVRRVPSLASTRWKSDACSAMRKYVEWLIDRGWSRHVSCLFICYGITWEWGLLGSDRFPDYSPAAIEYFRDWLRGKYRTPGRLSTAWGRSVSFEEVEIPVMARRIAAGKGLALRPLPDFRDVVDYQLCLSDMNADFLLALCGAAREASGGEVLLGAFYGYTLTAREQTTFTGQYGAGGFHGGHHSLGRVIRSDALDILASPFNYADRSPGTGLLLEHSPLASIHRHGKVFFEENDLRAWTNLQEETGMTAISTGQLATKEATIGGYRMAWASAVVRGKHQWLTELTGWVGRFQENFSDPDLLAEIWRLNAISDDLLCKDRRSVTEMAFVIDERSVAHLPLDSRGFVENVYFGSVSWGHLGVPFDVLLLDDLLDLCSYRLVVAGCIKSPEAVGRFRAWAGLRPENSVLWDGNPEFFPPTDPSVLLSAMSCAGVHRYTSAPVTVWANASMLLLHSAAGGALEISFRHPCAGREMISGRHFDAPEGCLVWELSETDVALFVEDPVGTHAP